MLIKPKHQTTAEYKKELIGSWISFSIMSVLTIIMFLFDYTVGGIGLVVCLIWAVHCITDSEFYNHRRMIELQCKIHKLDLLDLCDCRACKIRRNE